jgi:hypothetical protein
MCRRHLKNRLLHSHAEYMPFSHYSYGLPRPYVYGDFPSVLDIDPEFFYVY